MKKLRISRPLCSTSPRAEGSSHGCLDECVTRLQEQHYIDSGSIVVGRRGGGTHVRQQHIALAWFLVGRSGIPTKSWKISLLKCSATPRSIKFKHLY